MTQRDRHAGALTQTLAVYAMEERDWAQAEQWYRKALAISEKLGDESGAPTYHHLGIIAEEQGDWAQAEQWYRKALAIREKRGDEYGAAFTYHQLGRIAEEQGDWAQAGQWLLRSMVTFLRCDDRYHFQIATQNFLRCYSQAPPAAQATLKALWEGAGLGPLPAENARE